MEPIKLNKRLELIASYVKKDNIVADIGTDHAFLPIYLAQNGIAKKIYASDINEKPLENAKKYIKKYKLEQSVQLFLSNGLKVIPNDYQTVVIAGMGGELIAEILNATEIKTGVQLILQPMTFIEYTREFLYKNNFKIIDENLVMDENKLYTVLNAVKCDIFEEYSLTDTLISKKLLDKKSELKNKYIKKLINKHKQIYNGLKKSANNDELKIENEIKILEILENL